MAVTTTRSINITMTGDVQLNQTFPAASNAIGPGDIDVMTLAVGANTIPVPNIAAINVTKGATIIPPSGNVQTITLKGIAGDTGVALHKTDPTSIAFDSPPPANIVLTAGAQIDGLRIVWT